MEGPSRKEVLKGKWPFGGKGKSSDVPNPSGSVCKQISEVLARADNNAGEYSFGGLADTLPAVPGLEVRDVGPISVPLCPEQADKLIAKCDKSPFGRKLDTLMDENVRKSWQLAPDQVDIKNPLWHSGMDTLSEVIADRLGYKGVPLQCKLYKLLVYGEGGHFVKHQDTEKEDGMVATLVVQLPSLHEGGDLVVYRGGKEVQRHDFGKKDGTAAYLPQYAVHYADAEHGLEKVTKGYRLVLVYSISLPPAMRHLTKSSDDSLGEELGSFISGMEADENSFALLLAHEYTEKSIEELGSGSFKGIDRTRFQTLEEANRFAASDKKLQLFIAQLKHDIDYWDDGGSWEENRRDESITWYSPSGEILCDYPESNFQLNLLNPGKETFSAFWANHGTSTFEGNLGNEGATRKTTYSRFQMMKPNFLHSAIEAFSQHIGDLDESSEKLSALKSIVETRIQWLNDQLMALGKPFSWEMPDASFPDNAQVQAFLRGPRASMNSSGIIQFSRLDRARSYTYNCKRVNASFTMAAGGRGRNAYVTITKTSDWFSQHQKDLVDYQAEVKRLSERFIATDSGARKRARYE
ncbi:hypothetical protein PRNP1_002179 [Phytophthora ramorum]